MKYTKAHLLLHAFVASTLMLTASIAVATSTPLQLQSGVTVGLSLQASQLVSNAYIDVDDSARQLTVNVAGNGGDLDLFLRSDSPFPGQGVSEDLVNRYAHYHSVSGSSTESILVLPSSRTPLHAGRWYIDVLNSSQIIATGTLTATISTSDPIGQINLDFGNPGTDCDDTFWTDITAATPVGGNTATTLGQQRKNALSHAASELVQQLQIPNSITVHACGAHLGGDANSAILAHAAPLSYLFDDPQFPIAALPKKYTWYSGTSAVRLAGTSQCGLGGGDCSGVNNEEIEATFNADIGNADVIGGEKFYLGLNPDPSHSLDFVTIAMHEMTHGLGFFGLVNLDATQGPIGAKAGLSVTNGQYAIAYQGLSLGPYDDIYDDSIAIVNNADTVYTPFMGYEVNGANDAARATAVTSGPIITDAGHYIPGDQTGLRWSDPVAVNASGINNNAGRPAPDNFPSLYAPCLESATTTCTTVPSSTLSHTIQPGDMMNAFYSNFNLRNMGLAVPMLAPLGWSNATVPMPVYGQTIPSNWFDSTHSGHGFDFQIVARDPQFGHDVYLLTFYTYASDGTPEWYQAQGSLVDGVFLAGLQSGGETLYRLIYDNSGLGSIHFNADSICNGDPINHIPPCSVIVDFNQAANSPACRNTDRRNADGSFPLLGVMSWSIGSDPAQWCVQPIVSLADHATPDFNGHWYAPHDGGWGFELLDVKNPSGGAPTVVVYVYYPGPNGQPTWATASGTLQNGAATLSLLQVNDGYCRTCPTPPQGVTGGPPIGSITLNLSAATSGTKPTGTASITANYPGGGGFNRTRDAITQLSVPTGQ